VCSLDVIDPGATIRLSFPTLVFTLSRSHTLIAFNTGHYQAIGLSPWLATDPDSLREENVGVPKSVTVKLARHRVFFTSKEGSSQ
jgi:hypothetical protein